MKPNSFVEKVYKKLKRARRWISTRDLTAIGGLAPSTTVSKVRRYLERNENKTVESQRKDYWSKKHGCMVQRHRYRIAPLKRVR